MGVSLRFENIISSLLARNVGIHLYHFFPIRNVHGGSRTSWLIQSCIGLISAVDHSADVLTCINDGFLYLQTCWYQLGYSLETYRMFRDVVSESTSTNETDPRMVGIITIHTNILQVLMHRFSIGGRQWKLERNLTLSKRYNEIVMLIVKQTHERSELLNGL